MRIKEFHIGRYGPLLDSGHIRLGQFNLFWGENEDGKTLTLEALIRMLLGKGSRVFPGIQRVTAMPEGYVLVEDERGEEYKLPEGGTLSDLFDLSPEECRNLFIIRNSDLSLARENQFYGDLTERLTGLRTSELRQIKAKLREYGYFTEGLDTINTRESHHLKQRLQQAEALLEESRRMMEEALSGGYDALEEKLVHRQIQYQQLEREVNLMEMARLREKYHLGRENLIRVKELKQEIQVLPPVSEEEFSEWQQCRMIVEEKEQEKEHLNDQYRSYEKELAEEEKNLDQLNQLLEITRKRKEVIDQTLKPQIKRLGEASESVARLRASRGFVQTVAALLALFAVTTLGAGLWKDQTDVLLMGVGFALLTLGTTGWYFWRYVRPRADVEQLREQILHQAAEAGMPGETLAEVQEQIQRVEENLQRQQQKAVAAESRIIFLQEKLRELQGQRLPDIDRRLNEARLRIQQIQARHGVEYPEEYRERLLQRQAREQQLKEALTTLKNLFGMPSEHFSENLQHWEKEIEALAEYQREAPEVTYDEGQLSRNRSRLQELRQQIEQIQREMREFREQLADLQRRVSEVILPREPLPPCRMLTDIQFLQEQLQGFIDRIEREQRIARNALIIFDEIESQEKEKVTGLFGKDSRVSRLYRSITDGLYPAVYYDMEGESLVVERSDGRRILPQWLSGGAYDQLYFAIRIALAAALLRQQKGLFILDDPFLKSDTERLRRQLEFLVEISRRGWQIIYFSAKQEVREVLQRYIDRGDVRSHSLPPIAFKEVS